MNKQEAIDKIEDKRTDCDDTIWGGAYDEAIDDALAIVRQLDEPEKPVVPRCVADMIVKRKRAGQSVVKAIENLRFYEDACKWVRNNGEAFVKAWLYGYEVKKEKLYTTRLKLISVKKYSYINREKDEKRLFISDSDGLTDVYQTHFTQAELEELDVWNNPAFEIEEVEK
ncbi:DUF1642 domain-containing protein [Streptococcus lutetiensis]|uniref:DUF1642 domain-containing protein n=1 Tax=Streptococcus lutetiensis TaxID=150055 RepID=UPI001BDAE5E7|nr:DUF1642 domain-containing protein [Streptococcus lutetiensis]MBT0947633.1 DUF1642 domain-containing protein [Streptococcus lutetiensis]